MTPQEAQELRKALDSANDAISKKHVIALLDGVEDFECVLKAAALLLALHDAGELQGWRSIESAPRDGTQIIVNAPQLESESTYAYWDKGWHLAYDGKPFGFHVMKPTHWRPLPKPPQPVSDTDKLPEKKPASVKNQEEN